MKCDIPVPIERLVWFQKRLGLEKQELEILNRYLGLFADRKEAFSEIPLETLILDAIERLRTTEWLENVQLVIELNADYPEVQGSQQDLAHMFYYLLQS